MWGKWVGRLALSLGPFGISVAQRVGEIMPPFTIAVHGGAGVISSAVERHGVHAYTAALAAALEAGRAILASGGAALDAVEQRCVSLGHDAFAAARADVATRGLKATVGGSTLGEIARDLMPVFLEALRRRAVLDDAGRDERVWLEPLAALAADDRSVADALFEGYDPSGPDAVAEMIRRAEF
jgi:glutamate--cysteine ligase